MRLRDSKAARLDGVPLDPSFKNLEFGGKIDLHDDLIRGISMVVQGLWAKWEVFGGKPVPLDGGPGVGRQ
jgi:hypothetical protein